MSVRPRALAGIVLSSVFIIAAGGDGCSPPPEARNVQAEQAARAANSVRFSANAEIENIKRRLEITSDPTLLGYIILLNEAGQPILYEGVHGKVTSGSKRLNEPDRSGSWGAGTNNVVRAAPSDEGTWGSSAEYIFYWNLDGTYRQWSGKYLYSTQPIRLRIDPLVVTVAAPPEPPAGQRAKTAPPKPDALGAARPPS